MTNGVEIRKDDDGGIDEVIIDGGSVHMERMDTNSWFIGVDMPNGDYWQFWLGAKNRRTAVDFRHTEHSPNWNSRGSHGTGDGR